MKTIALVDWNWMGHHPMYFRHLMRGFLAVGCDVAAFCPEAALNEVKEQFSGSTRVTFNSCKYAHPRKRLPMFLRSREQAIRTFGSLELGLIKWEKQHGRKIDLVFFQTIYDAEFENIRHAARAFRHPWSGIYLHARSFRLPGTVAPGFNRLPCPERVVDHPCLRSICLLDEGVVDQMQALVGSHPAISFPDITDEKVETPLDGQNLAGRILRYANGRKIVACVGYLQKTKGILELCHAARDPQCSNICFFFGGEVNWYGMSQEESQFIRSTWEQCPNVITHLTRIVSDASINAVIKASDIVFAAYTNFPNSSNIMTKAAMLGRPIIVSDGHLMAERVTKHRLGAIVSEGSVADIVKQIQHLCGQGGISDPDYQGYFAKHSSDALKNALAKVIQTISQ